MRTPAPRGVQSIMQIALQRLGIVLVSAILGPGSAAVYAAVTRFLVFGQLGAQAITSAVQPAARPPAGLGDRKGAGRIYQISTCWLVLLAWPLYLGLAVFSEQIPQFFGQRYDAGTGVLIVLAGAMLIATGSGLVDVVLAMAGQYDVDARQHGPRPRRQRHPQPDPAAAHRDPRRGHRLGRRDRLQQRPAGDPAGGLAAAAPLRQGTVLAMANALGWLGLLPAAAGLALHFTALVLVPAMAVGLVGYAATAWRLRSVFELEALMRAGRRRVAPVDGPDDVAATMVAPGSGGA